MVHPRVPRYGNHASPGSKYIVSCSSSEGSECGANLEPCWRETIEEIHAIFPTKIVAIWAPLWISIAIDDLHGPRKSP